jgi:hypothetical protein
MSAETTDPYVTRVNEVTPGGAPGPTESLKRAVITALREAFNDTTLLDPGAQVHIDMEYPLKQIQYPAIWVQFSLSNLRPAGIGHELILKNTDDPNWTNWEPMREWFFDGRVTLTVLSLTSLQRDRISDALTAMLSFSRPPTQVITNPSKDTKRFRQLITSLAENPYVSVAINHGSLTPGGQSVTPGVPWDEKVMAYEDTLSFEVFGQYNIVFKHDGTYTLRAVAERPYLWGDGTDRDFLLWCAKNGLDPRGQFVYQMWVEAGTPDNDEGWV